MILPGPRPFEPCGDAQERCPDPYALTCELCDGEATADDWTPSAGMLVCPHCLEALVEQDA